MSRHTDSHTSVGRPIGAINWSDFALGTRIWFGTVHGQRVELELVDELVGGPLNLALVRVLATNVATLDRYHHQIVAVSTELAVDVRLTVYSADAKDEIAHLAQIVEMLLV